MRQFVLVQFYMVIGTNSLDTDNVDDTVGCICSPLDRGGQTGL